MTILIARHDHSFSGVNPKSLAGTRTAVYAIYDFSEFEMSVVDGQSQRALLGIARTFAANRLSFTLNLKGWLHVIFKIEDELIDFREEPAHIKSLLIYSISE